MENKYKNLGKVRPTVEGDWDIGKSYKVLSIVFDEASNKSYISIKDVPKGISILNKKYWGRFGNNRIDSDSIVLLSRKNENGDINTYTLEEAINSISIEDRRIGLFISFYEKPIDANSNYHWNMYQFNSNDINDWGNLEAWSSIYYIKTKFFGLQVNEEALYYVRKNPDVGDYAFVGDTLKDAVIYRCYSKNIWKRTEEPAVDYLSIVFKGNITVGSNGNWFQDGIDTGIKARGPQGEKGDSIKGDKGDTPIMRLNREEGYVQFGYDGEHWNNLIPITDFIIGNNADEEDITSDDNNKLKFADRSYNPDNFSGKGYKILRKNIVEGKNVLTQEMINEENTVYEVRYDFDLNGDTINIPMNSILYFNGGILQNGTILNIDSFNVIKREQIFNSIKTKNPIDVYSFSNSVFGNSDSSTLYIRKQEDFDRNITNINNGNITKLIVLTDIIISSEITVLNNLTITSYNNSTISFGKLINITQAIDETDSHYIVQLDDYQTYDAVFDFDKKERLNYAGERKFYTIYGSEMEAWNISSDSKEEDEELVLSDENVYARFKLSDELLSIIGTDIPETDVKNIRLSYTTGFQNYQVPILKIKDGYVYFKNPEVNSLAYFCIFGANSYGMSCVYSLFNIEQLIDEDTIFVSKENKIYIPKKYVNCLYTAYNSSCFDAKANSNLKLYSININCMPLLLKYNLGANIYFNKCNITNIIKTIRIQNNATLKCIDCNFYNAYEGFFLCYRAIDVFIENNKFKNAGLLKYNSYVISAGMSSNVLVRYNNITNFLTGIGGGISKRNPAQDSNIVIYGNTLTIEKDYITWEKAITDYGTIYIATGNKGTNKYKPDLENYSTYVMNNVVINKSYGNKGRGIYLDDGAYNTKVEGNLVYGYSLGIYARTVTKTSTDSAWTDSTVFEFLNTNNKFVDNLIFEGTVNIGAREDRNNPPIIEGIFVFSKDEYITATLTNLNNAEKSNIVVSRYYNVTDNTFIVTQPIYNYIQSYKKNAILSSKLSYLNIDYLSSKKYRYSKSLRINKIGGNNNITYPEKGAIHIQIPFYLTSCRYNLRIKTKYSWYPAELTIKLESYNGLATAIYFVGQGCFNFQKVWCGSIKTDVNNLYADIWIESPINGKCGVSATPDNWLKALEIYGELIIDSGVYNSSSIDTTNWIYAKTGTYPIEANQIFYEVKDKPEDVDYNDTYTAVDRNYYTESPDIPIILEKAGTARLLQKATSSTNNPILFTVFESLTNLQNSEIGKGYYLNGGKVLYYDGSSSFNLDGTPVE